MLTSFNYDMNRDFCKHDFSVDLSSIPTAALLQDSREMPTRKLKLTRKVVYKDIHEF